MFVVFAFTKTDNQNFRFVIVGDRTGNCVSGVFDEIIDEISVLHPDFVINVGNLIHGYTEDTIAIHTQWDTVLNIVERLPCKFYFVPGNHDIQNEKTREIYEKRTGSKTYYSFDYKNSHFIILDNSITQWSMAQAMDEQQKEWLTQDIEEHKDADNIFVFFHTPAYLNAYATNIPDPLLDMFSNYQVRAIFSGYLHFYMRNLNENTELIVVGSSGAGMYDNDPAKGNFYHFLFVTVQDKDYDIAVIKKGNIFLRNVFTGSDYHALERAQQEAITFSDCIVKDESKKTSCKCTMTINNTGIDSIIHPLMWNFD
jgi:3',5'-cyclic AMP phosphodiesterase CpdA